MNSTATAALTLALATGVFASEARAQDACTDPEISIEFGMEQPSPSARQFGRQIIEAIEAVCQWWGPTFDGPVTIFVEDYFGPSMALVPAWRGGRGHMLFAAPMVSRGRPATIHEVTHVYAPNANRFLAEGLAVFAHEYLSGPVAYPNFGGDLHHLAHRLLDRADLLALDRLATPSRMFVSGLNEREAYIVAGSFVRFLVTEFGLERFRELYAPTRWFPANAMPAGLRDGKVYNPKLQALCKLVADEIAANPVTLDGFDWCAMPQPVMAAKLGFSVETIRRFIGKPPFVRAYRKIGGKKIVLLREGEPGSETNYDIAQIMSAIWRKFTGKRTNLKEFHCLLGLAGEWPDGLQITFFKLALWDWQFFMSGVKYEIDRENSAASLDGKKPKLYKKYFKFPAITVIRRFAFVMVTIVVDHGEDVNTMLDEMQAVEAGKPVPTWCKAINPEAWKTL